jgi:hypothetical protein
MVAEYLEKALHFEQMAEHERDQELKTRLLDQAKAVESSRRTGH